MKGAAKRAAKSPYKVQVLDRAVHILEFIGKQRTGDAGLPELSAAMRLHKTTTHRIAHVLESHGLLRRDIETNRYRLGLHLYDLGCQALEHVDLRAEARPLLERIALEVGETVHLALLDRSEVLYIERVEAQRPLAMGSKLGARNPPYCTALGKAILSWTPEEEVDRSLSQARLQPRTRNTITSVPALKRELKKIHTRGYSIDDEEIEDGVRCIGAPVLNSADHAVAAISISGPSSRVTPDRYKSIGETIIKAAAELSIRMGYRTAQPRQPGGAGERIRRANFPPSKS